MMAICNVANDIKAGEAEISIAAGSGVQAIEVRTFKLFAMVYVGSSNRPFPQVLARLPFFCHPLTPMLRRTTPYKQHLRATCLSFAQPMGWTSEIVAQISSATRETYYSYALRSHSRSARAQASGLFAQEIVPLRISETIVFEDDDLIRPGIALE